MSSDHEAVEYLHNSILKLGKHIGHLKQQVKLLKEERKYLRLERGHLKNKRDQLVHRHRYWKRRYKKEVKKNAALREKLQKIQTFSRPPYPDHQSTITLLWWIYQETEGVEGVSAKTPRQ